MTNQSQSIYPPELEESVKIAEMVGVREYQEGYGVELCRNWQGRLVIRAYNEAKFRDTEVDLLDLIGWLRQGDGTIIEGDREGSERKLVLPSLDVGATTS